jgi:hypothetical protein
VEIHTLPYKKEIKITGGNSNNRIEIVKKIMKEKAVGAGNKSEKSRE